MRGSQFELFWRIVLGMGNCMHLYIRLVSVIFVVIFQMADDVNVAIH